MLRAPAVVDSPKSLSSGELVVEFTVDPDPSNTVVRSSNSVVDKSSSSVVDVRVSVGVE